jgi:hypothetical protein
LGRSKKRQDGFCNKPALENVKDGAVQLRPTTATTCLLLIDDEPEDRSDVTPDPEEPSITAKTTVIAVKPSYSARLRTTSAVDIAGDIEASLVEQTQ